MAANIKPGITDKEFLEREIKKWITSPERKKQIEGEAYYDGKHNILNRERTVIGENGKLKVVDNLPNNRIVDNQYAKMVDQKANYQCGRPITFDTKNAEYGKQLTKVFTKKIQRTIRILAGMALTGGKAWLFPYYNGNGDLAFAIFPAHEILPFWADAEHTELDCAVHFFSVYEYDEDGNENIIFKVEVIHAAGIDRFVWEDGSLVFDNDAPSGAYITITDKKTGEQKGYNWERLPLICFKANHREIPLLCRVKCLQDALNLLLSNFANSMEEDVRNTVLVLHNYDGENLGEFRQNLATYGAVKVRNVDGSNGDVTTLTIDVNADNYKTVIDLLKKAIIENARGYDAKDERMNGTPNQMNIRSMYSDIDLDANGMEIEFQAAFEDLLWFINTYLANAGKGNFADEEVTVIFNRDILVNESEAIENCGKSAGIISNETIVKQHPWINDPNEELKRIETEKKKTMEQTDPYRNAFNHTDGNDDDPDGDE
ncbi:MAG: phage portal protein [Oscillospiraceae bacterium]|nr:phage portal protein [Oscillospiraceae bacterium]